MNAHRTKGLARRDFIRTFCAGTTVATVTLPPFAIEARADSEANDEKRKARYRAESHEIKTYYSVNRYPS